MSYNLKLMQELDITEDMYCGTLSSEAVSQFTCILCYGVVFNPIKCNTCEVLICKRCITEKKLKPNSFRCYQKCGSKNAKPAGPLITKILSILKFRCQNDECSEEIPYGKYFAHMRKKCKI